MWLNPVSEGVGSFFQQGTTDMTLAPMLITEPHIHLDLLTPRAVRSAPKRPAKSPSDWAALSMVVTDGIGLTSRVSGWFSNQDINIESSRSAPKSNLYTAQFIVTAPPDRLEALVYSSRSELTELIQNAEPLPVPATDNEAMFRKFELNLLANNKVGIVSQATDVFAANRLNIASHDSETRPGGEFFLSMTIDIPPGSGRAFAAAQALLGDLADRYGWACRLSERFSASRLERAFAEAARLGPPESKGEPNTKTFK